MQHHSNTETTTTANARGQNQIACEVKKRGRHWEVNEGGELLCLCVYKRGANAVIQRIGAKVVIA